MSKLLIALGIYLATSIVIIIGEYKDNISEWHPNVYYFIYNFKRIIFVLPLILFPAIFLGLEEKFPEAPVIQNISIAKNKVNEKINQNFEKLLNNKAEKKENAETKNNINNNLLILAAILFSFLIIIEILKGYGTKYFEKRKEKYLAVRDLKLNLMAPVPFMSDLNKFSTEKLENFFSKKS